MQARQTFVYARAGRYGWSGPWRAATWHGLRCLDARYRRSDGLYLRSVDARGKPVDTAAQLYDQAFVLLALAEAVRAGIDENAAVTRAQALRDAIAAFRWPAGGFREVDAPPFQANCHMHLFEACLAWLKVPGADFTGWRNLAAEIAALALERFIDGESGALDEFFDETWAPLDVSNGGWIEPGHQFEWAWLLDRWRAHGGDVNPGVIDALYQHGRAGLVGRGALIANRLSRSFDVLDGGARLWPQAEYLRAARMMWRGTGDNIYAEHVRHAVAALRAYLGTSTPGLWWDVIRPNGDIVCQPAAGSSLYHLIVVLQRAPATRSRG